MWSKQFGFSRSQLMKNVFNPSIASRKLFKRNVSNLAQQDHLKTIRNTGIIAHIDAGKTTTTERMLYFSGLTSGLGEVDRGDTVTDYMVQERERGITITSASVTFPWKKHRINLLDTPGHVDFTVEVERSLSVLDSAVVVLDSSRGVEAQTITVWSQADRHDVPRIVYLNKMDKAACDIDLCLKSIKQLGSQPLLTQFPVRSGNSLVGLVDVIRQEKYLWEKMLSDGSEYSVTPLDPVLDGELRERALEMREDLIGRLTDVDEKLSEIFLSCDSHSSVPNIEVINSVRRATINRKIVPVFLGSSFKNIGVQPLLDAVIQYLPSPIEVKKAYTKYYQGTLCCLAFKVIHHKTYGALTFIRVYSGQLKTAGSLYNINRKRKEKITKIYSALADDFKEIPIATAGSIVVVSGLTCVTGDTLVNDPEDVQNARNLYLRDHPGTEADEVPVLAGPKVPDPVFFCTVEPPSSSKEKLLEQALSCLQREDPSIKVEPNDNGQFVLSGMGELHLEILKDRLLKEYKIDAFVGPLQVSYRETIENEVLETLSVSKVIGGTKNVVSITLALKPGPISKPHDLKVIVTSENELGKIRHDRLRSIKNGIEASLLNGPLLNFPIVGIQSELHEFRTTYATTPAFVAACASQCVSTALKKASLTLLEPMMKLEIQVPIRYSTKIISDLSTRRSQIEDVSEKNEVRIISTLTPLSELLNYSSTLRSLSSGTAVFSMDLATYKRMNESEKKLATERVTGFSS